MTTTARSSRRRRQQSPCVWSPFICDRKLHSKALVQAGKTVRERGGRVDKGTCCINFAFVVCWGLVYLLFRMPNMTVCNMTLIIVCTATVRNKACGTHASRHVSANKDDQPINLRDTSTLHKDKMLESGRQQRSLACAIPRNMSTVRRMKYRSWGYSCTELSLSTLLSEKGLKSRPLIVRVSNITSASFSTLSASSGLLNFTPRPLKLFTAGGAWRGGHEMRAQTLYKWFGR